MVDLSQSRIDAWNSDQLPIYEPGLLEIVRIARDGIDGREPNLFFSTDVDAAIQEAQMIFISVNTPTKTVGVGANKALDLTYIEAAARQIAEVSFSDKIVVEKSTVPSGTAQSLRDIFSELGQPGVRFEVLSNPEFLAEGTAIKDLLNPDRILLGSLRTESGLAAAKVLTDVYAGWVPRQRIVDVSIASSEMAKLAANCMLAQRISSINSLSALCESEGADINELAHAVGLDDRIGSKFLKASVGFGGSCFKKDVLSLVYMAESRHLSEVAAYWRAVVDINEYQKLRFTNRILAALNNTLANKNIAILGYAYKKDTSDTRESAAITVVGQLIAEHARVRIYDPKVQEKQIRQDLSMEFSEATLDRCLTVCPDAYAACHKAAAVVILTEWDEFKTDHLALPTILLDDKIMRLQNDSKRPSLTSPTSSEDASSNDNTDNESTASWQDGAVQSPKPPVYSTTPMGSSRLDWARIAGMVRRPRLVFDGRNVVEAKKLAALGFGVQSIGNAGLVAKRGL